jgi:hypothetical protein
MADEILSFSEDSARRIAEAVRRLEAQVRDIRAQVRRLTAVSQPAQMPVQIRTGKTHAGPRGESYPAEGCKFWVRLQDWGWDETLGDCDHEETDHEASFVFGKSHGDVYLPEGTLVAVVRISGTQGTRYILLPAGSDIQIGKFAATLNQGSSANVTRWQRNSGDTGWEATSPTVTDVVHDWLLGSGESVSSGKKVIYTKHAQSGKWIAVAVECE